MEITISSDYGTTVRIKIDKDSSITDVMQVIVGALVGVGFDQRTIENAFKEWPESKY